MKFLFVKVYLLPILIPLGTKYLHQDPVLKCPFSLHFYLNNTRPCFTTV